jgi:hypothetical protein
MFRFQLTFLVFIGFGLQYLFAQEAGISPAPNPWVRQAEQQLQSALKPPKGALYLFGVEHHIIGTYTYDLTIRNKGEVATVFVVSGENSNIVMQNQLKDRLKAFRFDLTIPKGQSYKFRYTFTFP